MQAKRQVSKTLLVLTLSLSYLVGGITSAFAVTYGTYENPFSEDSIWNTPIGSGAKYTPAGFSAKEQPAFRVNYIGIRQVKTTDPLRKVHKRDVSHFKEYCGPVDTSKPFYRINLPDNFIIDKPLDNGVYVFVLPDGSLQEGFGFERCSTGGNAAQMYSSPGKDPTYTIKSKGRPTRRGPHAAGMSGIGGVIRSGELTSAPGVPIPHALKLHLSTKVMYYSSSDSTRGYTWPALAADGYASKAYSGTNPMVELGSLLAIHPNYDCSKLKTEPGRKICRAFQTYGGYPVDTCCGKRHGRDWGIALEIADLKTKIVNVAMLNTYSINVKDLEKPTKKYRTPQTSDFKADMDAVYNNLMVVTNISPEYAKGPGGPITSTPKLSTTVGPKLVD